MPGPAPSMIPSMFLLPMREHGLQARYPCSMGTCDGLRAPGAFVVRSTARSSKGRPVSRGATTLVKVVSLLLAAVPAAVQPPGALCAEPRVSVLPASRSPARGLILLKRLDAAPAIDGNLSDWPGRTPVVSMPGGCGRPGMGGWQGEDDLGASLRTGWDDARLYIGAVVSDDRHHATAGMPMWYRDCLRVAVDPLHDRTAGALGADDSEFAFALLNDGRPVVESVQSPFAPGAGRGDMVLASASAGAFLSAYVLGDGESGVRFAARRTNAETTYELAVPWTTLGVELHDGSVRFGFNVVITDNDGLGRRNWLEMTPGLCPASGMERNAAQYATAAGTTGAYLLLVGGGIDGPAPVRAVVFSEQRVGPGSTVTIRCDGDDARTEITAPLPGFSDGVAVVEVDLPAADGHAAHVMRLSAHLSGADGAAQALASCAIRPGPAAAKVEARLRDLRADLARAEALAAAAEARGMATDYEQVAIATARQFIDYGLQDLKGGLVRKSDHVAHVLERALADAAARLRSCLAGRARPMPVPRYVTGRVEIRDGAFWGDTLVPSTGVRERRPVFFMGYGCFAQAIADIPKFRDLGCNIVQSAREGGGGGTVVAEDTVADRITIDSVSSAAKHDVVVDWLSNTEYFPHWARRKWPELQGAGGAFYDIKVDAPQARRIFELNLEACLQRIGDSPGLLSVCLLNEPTSEFWQKDEFRLAMWPQYLQRVHGSIENVNALEGTCYDRLEEVPVRPTTLVPPDEEMTPLWYDQLRFNMERLAAFHRFLTEVIHRARPGTLTHTKTMGVLERNAMHFGTEPDAFSYVGDLNGNDTWNKFLGFGDRYATLWWRQDMFHDLQHSLRPAPIINSENHVLAVNDPREIPPSHTDCVLWQGCIHGMAASVIWVWEHFYDQVKVPNPPDYYGNDTFRAILTRPENVMAVGRVGLDLMRLAPEVYRMQRATSPVAMFYGITAQIWSQRADAAMKRAYEAMSFTGLPVVFVSERQVREGALSRFHAVVLPSIRHAPDAVARAIGAYAAAGGKVWIIGEACEALGRDEYDRPRDLAWPEGSTLCLPESASPMALRSAMLRALDGAGIERHVVLKGEDGSEPWAVDYRAVPDGKGYLVSMANYWGTPKKVSIVLDGRAPTTKRDLRAGRALREDVIELQPLQAMLLRIE